MKKVNMSTAVAPGVPIHSAAVETEVLRAFPHVIAFLAHTRYDDGSHRQVGTVGLRTNGPSWTVEARDYDARARLRVVAASLDDALVLLDSMLGADQAPWEPDIYLQEKNGKKR